MGLIQLNPARRPSPPLLAQQKRLTWRHALRLLLCLTLGGSVAPLRAQDGLLPQTGVGKEIFTLIEAKQHPYLTQTDFSSRAEDLQTLYKAAKYDLIWLNRADSAALLAQTLDLLSHAADEGLNPHHYDVDTLKANLPGALQLPQVAVRKRAMFDTAVSLSLLRYLHDLHYGRVNPHGINFKLKLRDKKIADLPTLIIANRNQGQLLQLQAAVEPKLHQYQKLKKALAHYRELAAQAPLLALAVNKAVRVGDAFPQAEELKRFLAETGDLPEIETSAKAKSAARYDRQLSEGVKNFQFRHGLAADGVLGKETAAALDVPLAERVTQIELAMERIRWLPEIGTGPYIIVNIPAFQLWAFNDIGKAEPEVLNMRVVVGRAMKTQTPVLMAEMRFIDFMPYWNVPYSITKNEILPKLITNPGFLNSENMEIVAAFSDHAQPVPLTLDSLLQLKQGQLKIRQRPGKKNPLGKVKFMFPNEEDVYLHDTPSKSLFSRSMRDFSHGCVRIEKPLELAEFALSNQLEWSRENIELAMQSPNMKRVMLKKSIPVLFFYTTAYADQNDEVAFYRDIYGHDKVLREALKKTSDLSDQLLFISKNTNSTEPVE